MSMPLMTRRTALTLLGASALAAPFVRRARAEDAVLNVYNWADYIGGTTIDGFENVLIFFLLLLATSAFTFSSGGISVPGSLWVLETLEDIFLAVGWPRELFLE